jgi:ribosomal protein L32
MTNSYLAAEMTTLASKRLTTQHLLRMATRRLIMTGALLATGVVFATAVWIAPASTPTVHAQESPQVASLEIAIWPEFDRQAMALVVLRGKLADDVPLPATLPVHLPASSGGPSAVASADSETATLVNLDYELAAGEASLLMTMTTPVRYFQIEFYDPLSIDTSNRSYTYVWPGDLPVNDLTLEVQEPAGASDLSIEPELGDEVVVTDQLSYRSAHLGSFESGRTLTLDIRYVKNDLVTSTEILGIGEAADTELRPVDSDGVPLSAIVAPLIAVLVVLVGAVVYWRWRNRPVAAPGGPAPGARRGGRGASGSEEKPSSQAFCTQCGDRLIPGHRFCPQCGTAAGSE